MPPPSLIFLRIIASTVMLALLLSSSNLSVLSNLIFIHFIRLRGGKKVISFCTFFNVSAFILKNLDDVVLCLFVMLTTVTALL